MRKPKPPRTSTLPLLSSVTLSLLTSCSSPPPPLVFGTPPPAQPAPITADQRFDATWKAFLEQLLVREPALATTLGDHRFDGKWPDRSEAADQSMRSFLDATTRDLAQINERTLSPDRRVDLAVLEREIARMRFVLDGLHVREEDPLSYVGLFTEGLDPLVTRAFAPAESRAKSLASRLGSMGPIVAVAKSRLQRPSKIATETAIKQVKGLVALVEGGFPELLTETPASKDEVLAAAKVASADLRGLQAFFEKELLPRSDGEFRSGEAVYDRAIRLGLDLDVDGAALAEEARATLSRTQDEMVDTARELWPTLFPGIALPAATTHAERQKLVRKVLDKLGDDRPTNDTMVAEAKKILDETLTFVREKDLVGTPTEAAKVMEMPEYLRGVAIAYCDWSGPLEPNGETHITLSPVPADWPAARATSFYREYNRSMLVDLMIHEAVPGHYLQAFHANARSGGGSSTPRAVFANGAFVEGWAVYGEWLMASHGYGGPKVRIERQKMLVRVAVNAILDHDIHVGTMDEKAALALMQDEGFQEEGEAVGKWNRARLSVGQLSSYFYGYTELMKLRAAVEKRPGFTERTYHDALLSFGAPPIHALFGLMGEPAPAAPKE